VPRAPRFAVDVQVATRRARFPGRTQLRRWARAAIRGAADVTVRVVGEAEGRRLNRVYRGRDRATNVLSFAYERSPRAVSGDIALCAPVICREAAQQGKHLEAHYAHLVVHGLLHLQGHDHEAPRAARRMQALETQILAKLGYPDPYSG
jgi:probable rRNA maturation factor